MQALDSGPEQFDSALSRDEVDRLHLLNEIGREMASNLDLQTLYTTIYHQVGRVMDTSQFFIALQREEDSAITVPYLREEGVLIVDPIIPGGDSITRRVVGKGLTIRFDTRQEYAALMRRWRLAPSTVGEKLSESGIFVPLNTGSRTIGAITVQSTRPFAYGGDDVSLLTALASQAAVAIENARLYQRSQDHVRETETLLRVAQSINGSLDLATVLDAILTSMRDVIPYYFAAILLPDAAGRELNVSHAVGVRAEARRADITIPRGSGITGRVFASGEPLLVNDVQAYPGYIDHGLEEIRAEMAVPLLRGETVTGVLDVERAEGSGFTPAELALLSLFASQAAVAIENARLFEEQQRRVEELQTVQSVVQLLTPLHDTHSIAGVLQRELKRRINYDFCGLFMLDDATDALLPAVIDGADRPPSLIAWEQGLTGWVAQNGCAEIVPDTTRDRRIAHSAGTVHGPHSLLSAPLLANGYVRGVITLSREGCDQFDLNALRLLEIIAAQAAIAFDRARLYAGLRADAVTDPLTRLHNRRYLLDRLAEEQCRAERNQHPLAVLMVDLDRFKQVNDRYGHDGGDAVLVELAGLLRQSVRAEDIVARYGGEEFCIVVPELCLDQAKTLADRVRAEVDGHSFGEAGAVQLTMSIGVALLQNRESGRQLVRRADLAMYAAKQRGGNQVCVSLPSGIRPHYPALEQRLAV